VWVKFNPASQWQNLPDELRSSSGDREVAEIKASAGGWPAFCSIMKTWLKSGMFDHLITMSPQKEN
jgi:hypothetical protein